MRTTIATLTLVVLVSFTIWAQQPPAQNQTPAPLQGGQGPAAEPGATVAKHTKELTGTQPCLQPATYNVSMKHRVNVPQNAAIHDKEAELFYVIDGSGT